MRLYINTNEVPALKDALIGALTTTDNPIVHTHLSNLFERVVLCEELQGNIKRATQEMFLPEREEVGFE